MALEKARGELARASRTSAQGAGACDLTPSTARCGDARPGDRLAVMYLGQLAHRTYATGNARENFKTLTADVLVRASGSRTNMGREPFRTRANRNWGENWQELIAGAPVRATGSQTCKWRPAQRTYARRSARANFQPFIAAVFVRATGSQTSFGRQAHRAHANSKCKENWQSSVADALVRAAGTQTCKWGDRLTEQMREVMCGRTSNPWLLLYSSGRKAHRRVLCKSLAEHMRTAGAISTGNHRLRMHSPGRQAHKHEKMRRPPERANTGIPATEKLQSLRGDALAPATGSETGTEQQARPTSAQLACAVGPANLYGQRLKGSPFAPAMRSK